MGFFFKDDHKPKDETRIISIMECLNEKSKLNDQFCLGTMICLHGTLMAYGMTFNQARSYVIKRLPENYRSPTKFMPKDWLHDFTLIPTREKPDETKNKKE